MGYEIRPGARCAVIGYGSWATAIVRILLENEPLVSWYIADSAVAEHVKKYGRNPRYLRDAELNADKLAIYGDINEAVDSADIIILVVPSAYLVDMLRPLTVPLDGKFVISAIKGIIPGDYLTVAEYVNRRYGVGFDRIGIVAGPSHSEEVALCRLSYLTMVSKSLGNAQTLCNKFSTGFIRTNPSTDIYGVEYAAVLKNIYAICAGMAAGLGYGDNFLAVLVSNAAVEMNRFLCGSYDSPRDTGQSAYLGDLLVTCYSRFSRNRRLGTMIGEGMSVKEVMESMEMVAEGYFASACIRQLNMRFGIEMPIADCVYRVLYENSSVSDEMAEMTAKLI